MITAVPWPPPSGAIRVLGWRVRDARWEFAEWDDGQYRWSGSYGDPVKAGSASHWLSYPSAPEADASTAAPLVGQAVDEEALRGLEDQAYENGYRAAAKAVIRSMLRRLRPDEEDRKLCRMALELDDTRQQLRRVCAVAGDNDWEDNLYLADVVEKHLGRYLCEPP